MSLYTQLHNEAVVGRKSASDRKPIWWQDIPPGWRTAVVAPLHFEVCREYEVAADKTTGFDESDLPCYCAFRYVLTETRLDDEDRFYEEPVYAEKRTAWRLRDDRWLVFREVVGNYGADRVHSFFSLSETMPR